MASPVLTPPFRTLPVVVGHTENALRALLLRTLEGTPLAGYEEWVALNVLDRRTADARDGEGADAVDAVRGPLGLDRGRATLLLDALATRGLLTTDGISHAISPDGTALLAAVRPAVADVSRRVTEGLPAEDVAVAVEILDQLSARASQELAQIRR